MRSIIASAFAIALSVSALGGCAADPDDSASGASRMSASNTNGLSAELVELPKLGSTGSCHFDTHYLGARVPDADAETQLNIDRALVYSLVDPAVGHQDCSPGRGMDLKVTYTPRFNARGLLSMAMFEELNIDGSAHPNGRITSRNIDLSTGDVLELDDVIDSAGMATLVDACKRGLGSGFDAVDQACASSVTVDRYSAVPVYTVEADGLRIYPHAQDIRWADWSAAQNGALVRWSSLKGHIKNAIVARFQ